MKQAIIDIGSNSIRLKCYEIMGNEFKVLFRDKIMAGLAGYTTKGKLNAEGIRCACAALLIFRRSLKRLQVDDVCVFATASLRNIANTDEVLACIKSETGYSIEVLSGEQEAMFGFAGAMQELHPDSGAFFDIGGASTEIVTFAGGRAEYLSSFPIGSRSLYRNCVKKIIPGKSSLKKLKTTIEGTFKPFFYNKDRKLDQQPVLIGIGGTARGVLKLSKYYNNCDNDCRIITGDQLAGLCDFLCSGSRGSIDMIIKMNVDRVHTIIPGILILKHIFNMFHANQMIVGKYGVREGYLKQKIIMNENQ